MERDLAIGPSSNVLSATYDDETRELTLELNGGDYTYSGVPPSVADGLERAPSPGQFFIRFIRDRYPYS